MNVTDLLEECRREPSDINAHLDTLRNWVIDLDAQNVIELGVATGRSTVALLSGLEVTGGRLWSCEIEPHSALRITAHPQWTQAIGDDVAMSSQAPVPIDVLFIDTDHLYEHTVAELTTYGPKVRPGGVILLHDTELEPVMRACVEWHEATDWAFFNDPGCHGLGTFRVPR